MIACIICYTPKKEIGLFLMQWQNCRRGVFAVSNCQLYRCNTLTGIIDTLLDLPDNCVRALWKYKDYLFIGTYGKGYFIYRNGKMKAMPLDKNNFLLYVHGFIADKYGYCWMSTNRGLFKSSLADLLNAFEHNGDRIYYHYSAAMTEWTLLK